MSGLLCRVAWLGPVRRWPAVANSYRWQFGLPVLEHPDQLYRGPILDYLPAELSPATWSPAFALPAAVADAGDRAIVYAAIGTGWRTWRAGPPRHGRPLRVDAHPARGAV